VRLLYVLLLTVLSPLIYSYAALSPKLRTGLRERLGMWPAQYRLRQIAGQAIWLHGVSAGEAKLLEPLIRGIRQRLPGMRFFLTTITSAGRQVLDQFSADNGIVSSYFPLGDLPWIVRRFVRTVRPLLFVSTEAEAWPNLLAELKRAGVKSLLVNARVYPAGKPRWRLALTKELLRDFERILCQSAAFAHAFASIGVPPEKLLVSGNIKSDAALEVWPQARTEEFKSQLGWEGRPVLTAGSTHPQEEELILQAFSCLRIQDPRWVLALTPRHPERRKEVAALVEKHGLSCALLSSKQTFPGMEVLVVDKMGVLMDFYRIADLVILGGTFSERIGGHNILEPASLARPVIVGPHTDSIREQVTRLRQEEGFVETSQEQLATTLLALAAEPQRRATVGANARRAAESLGGAADFTAAAITEMLPASYSAP